jgi:hypothetical protein
MQFLDLQVPALSSIQQSASSSSLTGEVLTLIKGLPFVKGSGVKVTKKYIQRPVNAEAALEKDAADQTLVDDDLDREMELRTVWDVRMEMDENWYHGHVDAQTGDVIALMDWVSDATYEVYPLGVNDPEDGERRVLVDPADTTASPLGWHAQTKRRKFTTTRGKTMGDCFIS